MSMYVNCLYRPCEHFSFVTSYPPLPFTAACACSRDKTGLFIVYWCFPARCMKAEYRVLLWFCVNRHGKFPAQSVWSCQRCSFPRFSRCTENDRWHGVRKRMLPRKTCFPHLCGSEKISALTRFGLKWSVTKPSRRSALPGEISLANHSAGCICTSLRGPVEISVTRI